MLFEQDAKGERPGWTSQLARARMLLALANVQATLCAVLGMLGRIEGERGETSVAGAAGAEDEGGQKPQQYVPNWPQVRTNSNLVLAEEKLEWLLNCVPPGVSEGYDTLGTRSAIKRGVQSALLVRRHVGRIR